MPQRDDIRWLDDLGSDDVPLVGGKNASLGEMIQHLRAEGVRVPGGFATTAAAYRRFLEHNELGETLREQTEALTRGKRSLREVGAAIRRAIRQGEFPAETAQAIREAYQELCQREGVEEVAVAVRSSATAEDLPEASFAGQQETYLNVRGAGDLLAACRDCYASLFTDRAIHYREERGFGHLEVALSVGVQKMVRSDTAGAGVMFSLDVDTGFPDVVVISAAWGLGETVVQGTVSPDEYRVFKPPLRQAGRVPILAKRLGAKERKLVYARGGKHTTRMEETTARERRTSCCRTTRSWRSPGGPSRSSGTTEPPWTWSGRRTAKPASCIASRRGRRRCTHGSRRPCWRATASRSARSRS
jgi:pyruvate, water dikinase